MIIAGAGGHALEVLDILRTSFKATIAVYGERISSSWPAELPAFTAWDQVAQWLRNEPGFVLGVGLPEFREKLHEEFSKLGGIHRSILGSQVVISPSARIFGADVLTGAFIGAEVNLGMGVLVNAGAKIHHESKVGDFSVINPGAILLGGCELGNGCFIGAHATILPGVTVGNNAIIGAGAVIIRDVPEGVTMVGVPGRILSSGQKD